MPAKMFMNLGTSTYNSQYIAAYMQAMKKAKAVSASPSPLNASMINRVHFAKPGCGSCGK
jgi:hypothetical protein